MLRGSLMAATARVLSLVVALALSGAPRVAALQAPPEGHHCACPASKDGHHECSCALCRRAALSARATSESLPPCHRAAAREALSDAERGSREAPCVEGTCGDPTGQGPTVAGIEPFLLPRVKAIVHLLHTESRSPSVRTPRSLPAEPPTPPPRVV